MADLDIDATISLAAEHQRAGRFAQAEALYTEATLADQNRPDCWHMLGLLSGLQGRPEIAEFFILHAIELDDTRAAFYSNLGECYRVLKKWDEALTAYRRAIRLDPRHFAARHNLSLVLFELQRYDEAEESSRIALDLRPETAESWNILGNICYVRQNLEKAEEYYRKSLSLKPQYAAAAQNLQRVLEVRASVPAQ